MYNQWTVLQLARFMDLPVLPLRSWSHQRKQNEIQSLIKDVRSAPPSQLRASVVVKLFNCYDAMGRNANKQNRMNEFANLPATQFQQFYFFCNIFTCMDNYSW